MNSKHHGWLAKQISLWVDDGIIDQEQASRLRARYPQQDGLSFGKLLISSAGAIMIGLGVVLLFAYNWAEMSKGLKLTTIFTLFGAAHVTGLVAGNNRPVLSEGLFALGTMLMGASIFLVGQIYHLDSHYPDAFLLWSLGALALAWARPSLTQAFMAIILVITWHMLEVIDFASANQWALPLVLFGIFPLVWRLHSPVLARFSSVAMLLSMGLILLSLEAELAPITMLMVSAALLFLNIAAGNSGLSYQDMALEIAKPAWLVFVVILFMLSFAELLHKYLDLRSERPLGNIYFTASLIVSQAAFLWLIVKGRFSAAEILVEAVVLIALLPVLVLPYMNEHYWDYSEIVLVVIFNLLLLGVSIYLMVDGARQVDRWRMVSGCMIFAALAMARYTDLFDSLVVRAAVFLVVGVSLFAIANLYQRSKKPQEVEQ
ncbi:MAG: DUF2157 domain-containing protein [Candidatus Thiodiazotropha sp.]